jgi:hypothetical protein
MLYNELGALIDYLKLKRKGGGIEGAAWPLLGYMVSDRALVVARPTMGGPGRAWAPLVGRLQPELRASARDTRYRLYGV